MENNYLRRLRYEYGVPYCQGTSGDQKADTVHLELSARLPGFDRIMLVNTSARGSVAGRL